MRILACSVCKSYDAVPEYHGKVDDEHPDPLVERVIMEHTRRDPMGHGGTHLQHAPFRWINVDDDEWNRNHDLVIKKIAEQSKDVGFPAWIGESHNTFLDDAMDCYNRHHRPKEGCIDFWDESKRIGRPTAEGRAVIKDLFKLGEEDPHLCSFCPVLTWVQTQQRHRAGQYKG